MATLVGTGIVEYRHEWCNCGLWNIDMDVQFQVLRESGGY